MKRIALALALLLVSVAAFADFEGAVTPGSVAPRSALVGCINNTAAPVVGNGQQVAVQCDTSGRVITVGSSSGGTNSVTGPTGNNADGVVPTATGQVPSDSYNYGYNGTNWDRIRAVDNNTTTVTNTTQGVLNTNSFLYGSNIGNASWAKLPMNNPNGDSNGPFNMLMTQNFNYAYNSAVNAWDRIRTIGNSSLGVLAIGIAPNSDPGDAIVPVTTATAGSQSLILKGSAGNLYTITADNASQNLSGKLIVINSATVPAVGTLTSGVILDCVSIMTGGAQGANVTKSYNPGPMPRYGAGIVALFSTAQNCGTWTPGGMSGYISGTVQ